MSRDRKALIVLAVVMTALGAWANAAHATVSSITITEGGEISAVSEGSITFEDGARRRVACAVTLRGTLRRGTVRIEETIGGVTGLTWGSCGREGSIGTSLNLPWSIRLARLLYLTMTTCNIERDLSDPLNNVSPCGVLNTLSDVSIEVTMEGRRCLYGGRGAALGILWLINLITGRIGIWPRILISVGLRKSSGECGTTGTFAGSFREPTQEEFLTFS